MEDQQRPAASRFSPLARMLTSPPTNKAGATVPADQHPDLRLPLTIFGGVLHDIHKQPLDKCLISSGDDRPIVAAWADVWVAPFWSIRPELLFKPRCVAPVMAADIPDI